MYNPKDIEPKWQKKWEDQNIYAAHDFDDRKKFYVLVEFPYPSGAGLHVGHVRSYTAMDIIARKKRMDGFNVMYPIGWDAFGLPTENYAIKNKIAPQKATEDNVAVFKKQIKALGISFDWDREINTTDPSYYKWTQWIFLQLFKNGLAYKATMPINWCPSCKIGLANEEVVNGNCERCGTTSSKKELSQWMLKITEYAERLISDLDDVDFLEKIKAQQINWIGRSEGAHIVFDVKNTEHALEVFTTRPDTLFGVTYMVVAPEHFLLEKLKDTITNWPDVQTYITQAQQKSDLERSHLQKDKTGIKLEGISAVHPLTGEEIPVYVADYVLVNYGTGAIMAVPSDDERDAEFAEAYGLETRPIIENNVLINSGAFTGLSTEDATSKIIEELASKNKGEKAITYKLRDWVFSRQHYWGEPIPIVYCDECGMVPLPEDQLPLELPVVQEYEPTDTGESPLAKITDWVNTECPKCSKPAKRETDTMPNWAGSSWYWLRYIDPQNDNMFADPDKLKYWTPVDIYNGGMEHTTLHLLYSRFWHKFLHDQGFVPTHEPYQKRVSHGLILAEDHQKMSKSKGNVVNPDDVIQEFGADTLRVYEMFMGPYDEPIPWSTQNIVGVRRFLDKIASIKVTETHDDSTTRELHKMIKKVTEDIDTRQFNTAVSAMMIFVNAIDKEQGIHKETWSEFVKILSPFAPHLAEELWESLGNTDSVTTQSWPTYNESLTQDTTVTIAISINGKVRGQLEVETDTPEETIKEQALALDNVVKYTEGIEIKKIIVVPNKIVNIVI